ncbi:two-component regulator propeller domain-containing protein [Spirosoma fluminis]
MNALTLPAFRTISVAKWLKVAGVSWLLTWVGVVSEQDRLTQFEVRHIQEKDGLSFNTVSCFLQDRDGFLWIGTFDGLNRYDGNNFTHFKNRRGDPGTLLNTLSLAAEAKPMR